MSKYKGFTEVELRRPKRSMFDMSHENRLSTRIGKLTPVLCVETLPNDTFQVSTEVLVKLAPLIAPIFHRLNMYVHFFFVPQRLVWEDWEDFITGGRIGAQVEFPPVPPHFLIGDILNKGNNWLDVGSVADYLDIPPIPDANAAGWQDQQFVDARPFAAWYKIWSDYYRDRNFTDDLDETILPMQSGVVADTDNDTFTQLLFTRYRCWEHDYLTSALPWTQRGTEVLMPLAGTGNVTYLPQSTVLQSDGSAPVGGNLSGLAVTAPNLVEVDGAGFNAMRIENIQDVELTASSVSINDFRTAIALQQWFERNALAGSRYNESIMAHFGRRTSDGRLQRAEYLGGGKAVIQITEVMTTAYSEDADAATVPPGNMAGRGSTYSQTNRFRYNCEEHGFIIGVLSVMPTSAYMQGIPRMFTTRFSFYHYPWPTFAHLGEEEVWSNEVYMAANNMGPIAVQYPVFGYQSRYAAWKTIHSSSHGDFRTTLDFWHLTRKFAGPGAPVLGADFVTFEDALQDRIFNVEGVDTLWMYIYNQVKAVRSLPYFAAPGGLTHG